ncbi:substrate-binding periplasmic protein [Rheinheimera sp. MM224]|uniref:substrate-binding periplasmic protein n=1 Tax=Rheinheimera sp. MM224 TaxID=3019969 RepID=UPI0021F906DC|nr:transporter substrate-binding domain-containing protein [Rheinheimera sp. MM224]
MFRFLLCFVICWAYAEKAVAKEELRFLMPDYPPYTYQESGHNKGIGYEAVAAIMADLEQPFSVQLVPHFGRAIVELQQDTVDGFFLATESDERNKNAEFSEAVLTIQWTWVWLKQRTDLVPGSANFKHKAQVSAQTNSNTFRWLKEHHYQVTAGTTDIRGLLNLLKFKRVDAILLPELTIKTLMAEQDIDTALFSFQQEITLPFAIYINKTYLNNHPQFMQQLNVAIRRYHAQVHDEQSL